jgi:predicted membrane protein
MPIDVNLVTVLVATAVASGLGFLWYSPLMFGNVWMRILRLDKLSKKEFNKDMWLTMGTMFLNTFLVAWVMAMLLRALGVMDIFSAYLWAVLIWASLMGGTMVSNGLFAKTRKKVLLIDASYRLMMLIAMVTVFIFLGY